MNDRDFDKMIERCRKIADGMAVGGWSTDAEIIRSLCRSRVSARETNRRLALDNRALRHDFEAVCQDLKTLKIKAGWAGIEL